jgi:hypothetical protein
MICVKEPSARRTRRYQHSTQQTQEANIHALSGIQNYDPSNKAAAERRFRQRDHRDRPYVYFLFGYLSKVPYFLFGYLSKVPYFLFGYLSNVPYLLLGYLS